MAKKKKTKHGSKTRAGQLLSQFIREIAEEESQFATVDGEDKMITKAEALVRNMWKMALGYAETVPVYKDGKQVGNDEIVHIPDKTMMALIWERMEGRAPTAITDGDEHMTAADKVSEQAKKRIAQAGGL